MLEELRQCHADLVAAIDRLGREVHRPSPDMATVTSARLGLVRVSTRRRALLVAAFPTAAIHSRDTALAELRARELDLVRRSAEHIARWTIDAVARDWAGYRAASDAMRESMKARIADEQRVLYPLLEAAARSAARQSAA